MRLEDVFAQVFEQPADSFNDDSSRETVLEWSSLRNVMLLVAVENAYGIRFSNAEMATMYTLGEIRASVAKKGVAVS